MAGGCCEDNCEVGDNSPRFRRALWIALWVNAAMFCVELAGGFAAGSVSLLADSADFLGDAANYGLSLAVFSHGLVWRSRAALVKGLTMGAFGVFVLSKAAWQIHLGVLPEPVTMGVIAVLALIANAGVALMLYAFRNGDANMRSVWLCSRNDAIGNVAVMLAAVGVFAIGQAWPDLIVAGIMGTLALTAGVSVVRQARREMARAAE
ncbi:MAG: cation transporter [Burkholderiales bacterium]|nr:cation transporter [Burkholderiales bacterium]